MIDMNEESTNLNPESNGQMERRKKMSHVYMNSMTSTRKSMAILCIYRNNNERKIKKK